MTPKEVLSELLELLKRQIAGEITKTQLAEQQIAILEQARVSMTDEEFLGIQREILTLHHLLAKNVSAHGVHVPGNDPEKPN